MTPLSFLALSSSFSRYRLDTCAIAARYPSNFFPLSISRPPRHFSHRVSPYSFFVFSMMQRSGMSVSRNVCVFLSGSRIRPPHSLHRKYTSFIVSPFAGAPLARGSTHIDRSVYQPLAGGHDNAHAGGCLQHSCQDHRTGDNQHPQRPGADPI